jgi:hypothetical protein
MLDIKFEQFFDRTAVMAKVDAARRTVLSKWGSFVRTTARRSIRPRKRSAAPGQPPSSHVGLLRKLIFFGYDDAAESVVVGPTLFKSGSPTVPELLEFGGSARHWRTGEPAVYRAHPFMRPAEEQERERGLKLFENSVR